MGGNRTHEIRVCNPAPYHSTTMPLCEWRESNSRNLRWQRSAVPLGHTRIVRLGRIGLPLPVWKTGTLPLSYKRAEPSTRIELVFPPYQGGALPLSYEGVVEPERIELSYPGCKPGALPLSYGPKRSET